MPILIGLGLLCLDLSWQLVSGGGELVSALGLGGLFLLIGLMAIGKVIRELRERRIITFGQDGVEVVERGLGLRRQWRLPYAAYQGVLCREHRIRRPNGPTRCRIIELRHQDPERTLPLYVELTAEEPRKLWEDYARQLGLPALELSGGALLGRHPDDLDKPVRQLAAEGKATHRFDRESPPPRGLRVAHEAGSGGRKGRDRLRVTVVAGRLPPWLLGISAGFAALLLAAGLKGETQPVLVVIALLVIAGLGLAWWLDRRRPREIVVTRNQVKLVDAWRSAGRGHRKILKLDQIEGITVRGRKLVIAGDKGVMTVGRGLSHPALVWLKEYLAAAIATA